MPASCESRSMRSGRRSSSEHSAKRSDAADSRVWPPAVLSAIDARQLRASDSRSPPSQSEGQRRRQQAMTVLVKPESWRFPFNRLPAFDARDWDAIRGWSEEVAAKLTPGAA